MAQKNKTAMKKAILVTGCSSGIGRAISVDLARRGYIVFATVRRESDAESLRKQGIESLVPVCPLDLTRHDQIEAACDFVEKELARRGIRGLAGCVNNAGGGGVAPVELMDPEMLHTELRTRLVGPVALLQRLLPLLREGGGRIVWIVTPGIFPTPFVTSIHAPDFAVNCLARTLDIELARWGVRSVMVRCGGIRTERALKTPAEVEELLRRPRADLYRDTLAAWGREMEEFDKKRTPPEPVALTVLRALSATNPRRRYHVGYLSGAASFLEFLPQPLADVILKRRFSH
jgi:NAD(P)-dependent dehydrogenase (short-subunit alcohol dehydrogenase family)